MPLVRLRSLERRLYSCEEALPHDFDGDSTQVAGIEGLSEAAQLV